MLRFVTFIIASVAIWLSGAWWQGEDRKAASAAIVFAAFILALGALSGCASIEGEGDGFGGSNYAGTHQCSDPTPTGEKWRFCTAEEAAAQDAARRRNHIHSAKWRGSDGDEDHKSSQR